MVPNTKGVWYMHYIEECPLCGCSDHYRERRPAPAPPVEQRYQFSEHACVEHFL